MKFRFKRTDYEIKRDKYQFILSKHVGDKEEVIGFYRGASELINKLISLNSVNATEGGDLLAEIRSTCVKLGALIEKAVKVTVEGV